uniref:Uncharacterized protein n=1 Tax=Arundo donax TaxID=35708 RepID=A0A0A9FQW5_ARUDO
MRPWPNCNTNFRVNLWKHKMRD